jgi:hypothetical protein
MLLSLNTQLSTFNFPHSDNLALTAARRKSFDEAVTNRLQPALIVCYGADIPREESMGFRIVLLLITYICIPSSSFGQSESRTTDIAVTPAQIWGLGLSGTNKDIRDLEPQTKPSALKPLLPEARNTVIANSLIEQAAATLLTEHPSYPHEKDKARRGFVVAGTPNDALKGAVAVLVKDNESNSKFSTHDDLNLIFFAHADQSNKRIIEVLRRVNEFEIVYENAIRQERFVSPVLAIIPIGKLSAGEYSVHLKPEYKDFEPKNRDELERVVCEPFKFEVEQ